MYGRLFERSKKEKFERDGEFMIELIFCHTGAVALSMAMRDGYSSQDHASDTWLEGSRENIESALLIADMGDISDITNQQSRLPLLRDIAASHDFETDEWVLEESQRAIQLFQRLKEAASTGEDVRIWWSDAPGETCGFYWAAYFLQDSIGKIFSVKAEGMIEAPDGKIISKVRGAGELKPSDFVALSEHSKQLKAREITYLAKHWDRLVEENAPLRAVINGTLLSVGEEFYDSFLWENMPSGEFQVAQTIGLALLHGPGGISDFWYASRLRYFIQKGYLKVVEEKETFYGSIIARTNKNSMF